MQRIVSEAQSRKELFYGIDKLASAVIATLGPNGRNVLFEKDGNVLSTKDGVTVAKNIKNLDSKIQQMGAQLIKQAALQTSDKAGDGTTTSTLLAYEIIKQGLSHLNNKENAVNIKRDLEKASQELIEYLVKYTSKEISNESQLEQIATISSNNDPEVGELIATAIKKVGREGVVHIEESKSGETYLETVEGIQFDRGYKSHYFVTDNNNMSCNLENPYILIANSKFTQAKEIVPVLEAISNTNKSLLIIADDIEGEALATLIVNKARGVLKVAAVRAPDFGDRKKLLLEDIAILTGGVVFDKDKGMKLDKFSWDWLGNARAVTIFKDKTTIIDGKGEEEKISQRIVELQSQLDKAVTSFEVEKLQERLAKMVGGVSIIHVGGNNEAEMNEKKDRVDDALNATKAALEEGISPGGGAALIHIREHIKNNPSIGYKILYKACGKPFEVILTNAGYTSSEAQMLGLKLTEKDSFDYWTGYNINNNKFIDMESEGIIDPTKVIRVALQNAVSVAGVFLLTEAVIEEEKEKEKEPGVDTSMFGY